MWCHWHPLLHQGCRILYGSTAVIFFPLSVIRRAHRARADQPVSVPARPSFVRFQEDNRSFRRRSLAPPHHPTFRSSPP